MANEQEKSLYKVTIAGLPLMLRSSYSQETVNELVKLVDDKVSEVTESNDNIAFQKALLLAALHIAEDHLILKNRALDEIDRIETRTKKILSELDGAPDLQLRLDC